MKRLLFVYPNLSIGGSTTSLLALLGELDYSKYQVDVAFLTPVSEERKSLLPPQIRVLEPRQKKELTSVCARMEKMLWGAFGGGVFRLLYWYCRKYRRLSSMYRISMVNQLLAQINAEMSLPLETEYDVAVAFLELWATAFLVRKVRAKRKMAFLHIDYTGSHFAIELDRALYDCVDGIACVSPECEETFLSVYPQGRGRTTTVENLMDVRGIRKKAEALPEKWFSAYDGFKIVTVGRAQRYTKGIDRIIGAACELKAAGVDFFWCFVGDGDDLAECRAAAEQLGVSDRLRFLGARENPYPYIAGADLFVLPSRHEGKPMVVTEAQILGVPVLVTEYASARAQVADGVDGMVIANRDEGLAAAVLRLYDNREVLQSFKCALHSRDFSNAEKLERYEAILEGAAFERRG